MSIANEITRLQNAKSSIASAITNKGVTVPSSTLLDGMPTLIGQIQTGITPSGNKALTPSTSAQTGIDVSTYATASVDAITKELLATLDADFVAGNIKKDIDLFGLVGTLASGELSYLSGTFTLTEPTVEYDIAYSGDKAPMLFTLCHTSEILTSSTYVSSLSAIISFMFDGYQYDYVVVRGNKDTTGRWLNIKHTKSPPSRPDRLYYFAGSSNTGAWYSTMNVVKITSNYNPSGLMYNELSAGTYAWAMII